MIARAALVGLDEIRAEDLARFLDYIDLAWRLHPYPECLLFGGVWCERVGVASGDDLVKDRPDLIEVGRGSLADAHARSVADDFAVVVGLEIGVELLDTTAADGGLRT